jgi:general secretion pathway protein A
MTSQPFSERIDAKKIIRDQRIENSIAKLQYMLYQGDIALIHGPAGVGKSTLIKLFLANIPQNQYLPLYINFTHLKTSSLLNLIVAQLGESLKHTKDRLFLQIKEKIKKLNLTVLLIIDEAHLLETDTITDLRLLISSAIENTSTLKIILSGQDAIRENLKRSSLTDFAQRICVTCRISPLTKEECFSYIDLQMKYAQSSENIFQQEAKEMIFEYSSGIPRQINNIATASLITASTQRLQFINHDLMMQTISELQSF